MVSWLRTNDRQSEKTRGLVRVPTDGLLRQLTAACLSFLTLSGPQVFIRDDIR